MDRFVIRNPEPGQSSSSTKCSKSKMKQRTIESLKGVVVIDDILRHKSRLQLKTSTKETILESLKELGKKIPPKHVMLDTKIGRVVSKMKQHEDKDIAKAAKRVYVMWRSHFEERIDRPLMEVKCDLKTERLRNSGKKLLADALSVEETHLLPEAIEREAFLQSHRRIQNDYRRTMRKLVFTLKNQEPVRAKVLAGEVTVANFVKENKR